MASEPGPRVFLHTILVGARVMVKDFLDFVRWSIHLLRRRLGTERSAAQPDADLPAPPPHSPHPLEPPTSLSATSRKTCRRSREQVYLRDRLILDPRSGKVSIIYRNEPVIEGASASVGYRVSGDGAALSLAGSRVAYTIEDSEVCISQRDDHVRLDWYITFGTQVEARLEIRNIGDLAIQIDQLRVLEAEGDAGGRVHIGAAPRRWSVYQHGWSSWTPVFARHLNQSMHVIPEDERYRSIHLPHNASDESEIISSEWVTVLWGRGGGRRRSGARGLLLGFVTAADQLAQLRLAANIETFNRLEAVCYADGITLGPGESLRSETLSIAAGDDPLILLEEYADRLGHLMEARSPKEVPTGWCSWYYFFGENGEGEILENLAELDREGLPLDYVLIDDGYQKAIGDWLTLDQDKFTDMINVVETIHEEGRRAGIWLAPFGLDAQSTAYQEHPDWVVRDDNGKPVLAWQHFGQDIYALDLTHPDVAPWLADTFRTIRQEWGIELFKIDFIFAASASGRRHDPNVTRAQALRRGLEIIREAIGEEAFLLGCGAPQMPCVGMVDGMRVGPDVAGNWHPFWPDLSMPSAENALRNGITRYFTHGRLWVNDPDCVLVRDRDDQSDLVLSEMRSLVGIIALSGGMTLSSDNLPSLRKGRFKYLKQMLPPTGMSARPLDLFDNEMPQCLALHVRRPWGEWLVVGAINWEDRILATDVDLDALGLPAGQYHVFNYWPRRYMGVAENVITLDRHLPHETVILLFKPVSDLPELLTTTFHVAQTLSEITSIEHAMGEDGSVTMTVSLDRAGGQFGELWFTFPPNLKLQSVLVNGRTRKVSSEGIGIAHLGFSPNGPAEVKLEFVPIE